MGYVLVPVVAKSKRGLADRLAEEEFRLRVDGEPVRIESFERGATAPIGILFLQDLSGSMGIGSKLALSRELIQCVLDLARRGDEFAVASFSDRRLFVEVPFPGPPDAVLETAGGWKGYGRTALHDAVAWLPDLVQSRSSPRRAVVLVTDGVDNASEVPAGVAREQIRQAEVPVHVLGLETGSIYAIDSAGDKVHPLADVLHLIGWATGRQLPVGGQLVGSPERLPRDRGRAQNTSTSSDSPHGPTEIRRDTTSRSKCPAKRRSCGYAIAVAMRAISP